MTQGALEARILDGDRVQASAPPDLSHQLRLTAQAEADAWQQSAAADIRHDSAESAGAKALAGHLAAQREQLEAANARYEKWATDTSGRREAAGEARADLEVRGLTRQTARQRQAGAEEEPETIWTGGASSRQTSPPSTGPSSTSTRPPSPQAHPGRLSATPNPRPSPRRSRTAVPEPASRPMASPARMTRQPGSTGY